MIGIIPSATKTFEVEGYFDSKELIEGKLYINPSDNGRVYFYSTTETRSNPRTGYFPIWDGKKVYVSKFSNEKYLDNDVKLTDLKVMSKSINKDVANKVKYQHRRSESTNILRPALSDKDNAFTQCVKGILNTKEYTLIDLVDMSNPKLDEKMIANYYSALSKITFMRLSNWIIWMDVIFHMKYNVHVYKNNKKLISYYYPSNKFDTGIVKYDDIIKTKDDPFKKIIKILMIMENINKNTLQSDDIDDYTINNMLTTLNSKKSLSSQLFSRFIRMAGLSYEIEIVENDEIIFNYKES